MIDTMRNMLIRLRTCLKKLVKNDEGSVIVLSAITFSFLVFSIMSTADIARVIHNRVKVQQVADNCALAAANIQADALSSIAWINDGMAYIYYYLMRYAVDNAVYAVSLRNWMNFGRQPLGADSIRLYNDAYETASEEIPKGVTLLNELYRLELGIAIATPELMKMEIYRIAEEAGMRNTAFYPEDFIMYPRGGVDFTLNITREGSTKWIASAPTLNYTVTIEKTGDEDFVITRISGDSVTVMAINKTGDNSWTITWTSGDTTRTYTISNWVEPPATNAMQVTSDSNTVLIKEKRTDTYIEYDVDAGGTVLSMRYYFETDEWKQNTDGSWDDVDEGQTQYEIDEDMFINVTNLNAISIGNIWLSIPPTTVRFDGITATLTSNPVIYGQIGPAAFSMLSDNSLVVNGLKAPGETGEWKRYNSDVSKHRLFNESLNAWIYNLVMSGSYLRNDDGYRFGVLHAIADNDERWQTGRTLPDWAYAVDPITGELNQGWFNPSTGAPIMADYYQTWVCTVCEGNGCYIIEGGEVIPRPPCWNIDNDGDGLTDIRTYLYEATTFNNPPYLAIPYFRRPLVLTKDFFKYGITVGVWAEPTSSLVSIFTHPQWGYFGVASARSGVFDRAYGDFIYHFDNYEDRNNWVDYSFANLYEVTWNAKLFPVSKTMTQYDLDEEEKGYEILGVDNGTSFIYRMLISASWRPAYDEESEARPSERMRTIISPWEKKAIDYYDDIIEESVRH